MADTRIKAIQQILKDAGLYSGEIDGAFGPRSQAAFDALIHGRPQDTGDGVHHVIASSFADPRDVAAFRLCKAKGNSDEFCFKFGDNGIGFFKEFDCTGPTAACALPREDWMEKWGSADAAALKTVIVTANGKSVKCLLGDTMPKRANIHNGCGIDLNPSACKALALTPPVRISAIWQWLE